MEASQRTHVERMDKHSTRRAEAVRAVIRGLTTHSTSEPFPAMSDHYRPHEIPGQIGSVALPHELRNSADAIPVREVIERTPLAQHGFNIMGDFV